VSVLERSPSVLVKEIILVDDNNDDESVGEALKVLEKVRIIDFRVSNYLGLQGAQ
jgi:glycosyltransferase involved in cell wall biosynthesis